MRDSANLAKLPMRDLEMQNVPKGYPRPASVWLASEKALYRSMLEQSRFDTLVLPFQVQQNAFSREIRSFMSAHLAMAVADAGAGNVADPYVVGRALGDGDRRFELGDIFALANAVRAKRIVAGYVGHDAAGKMRITLHSYELGDKASFNDLEFGPRHSVPLAQPVASDRVKSQHFASIAFSPDATPLDGYLSVLPGMLKFLGLEQKSVEAKISRFDGALPTSPASLDGKAEEPARDAYLLQVLALLAPEAADRERERLMEKSLLAVLHMSPKSPDYGVLKARALMSMGLRPAAINALGTPATAEQRHLRAFLDGNLPAMRAVRPQVPAGARALLALLEERRVVAAYGVGNTKEAQAQVDGLKLPSRTWTYLARRAVADGDLWTQFENVEVKALLDKEMPVAGFTAKSLRIGLGVVGDVGKLSTALNASVLEHMRRHRTANGSQWCCQPLSAKPTQMDFADVMLGMAADNLTRRARFLNEIQGQPAAAMQFIATLDTVYKDHPDLTLARADAQRKMAVQAQGAEREGLTRAAYADAINVWYWEQGQTFTAARALEVALHLGDRTDFGRFRNMYGLDYPYQPYYSYWSFGFNHLKIARTSLENSAFDFTPVAFIEGTLRATSRWKELDQELASLGERFSGQPLLTKFMAQSGARTGDLAKAEKYYREGIRAEPSASELYLELGKLLFEAGRDESAARLMMSYPGLKMAAGENSVAVSNYADVAGSLFWWKGDADRAVPFYRVAAQLNNGSGASLGAATRLALAGKNYLAALRGSFERGSRYQSTYEFRDYLALLHALGHSKEAWEGFTALVQALDTPHVWESALVGHRIEGKTARQIAEWAQQDPLRNAGGAFAYAPMYLLRAGVTDRAPDPDLPARIAAIERPVWRVTVPRTPPAVLRPRGDSRDFMILGPDAAVGQVAAGFAQSGTKERVKSDLVYYAEAYAAVRGGKFSDAHALLEQAAELYNMSDVSMGYLLPIYAYAAARSKNVATLEKRLDAYPPELQRFDYHLARAIIAAVSGKSDKATESLSLALHRRPFTENRPIFPEYQYAEVCEWLFDATGEARYRAAALDWAKKTQIFQPWMAWSYAIEAKFATEPAHRARAIGMAHYLDPNSERLGSLPKSEVEKAAKEFAPINPFGNAIDDGRKKPI
jgi:hypothetical protein